MPLRRVKWVVVYLTTECYSTLRGNEKALHILIRSNHQDTLEIKSHNAEEHTVSMLAFRLKKRGGELCIYFLVNTWTNSGKTS